jgi:hypothetical protein
MDIPLFLLFVASMYLAGRLAERRGRNFKVWAGIAGVVGPFALPVLYLLPNRRDADSDSSQRPQGHGTHAAPRQSQPSDDQGTPISRQASAFSFSAACAAK